MIIGKVHHRLRFLTIALSYAPPPLPLRPPLSRDPPSVRLRGAGLSGTPSVAPRVRVRSSEDEMATQSNNQEKVLIREHLAAAAASLLLAAAPTLKYCT